MTEPTSVKILKLLERTSVRDRLCRLIQYGTKFLTWLMEQHGISDELLLKAKGLESTISLARKLYRIGKGFDHLRVAMLTIHLKDPAQRVLITLSKLCRFLFLTLDHLVWAGRLKLFGINSARWSKHSTRFWFLAIVFGLARDLYDIFQAIRVELSRLKHDTTGAGRSLRTAVQRAVYNNPALVLDTVKNCTDIVLPISALDFGKGVSSGWVGLMGVVSTTCSLVSIWNETLKLRYS